MYLPRKWYNRYSLAQTKANIISVIFGEVEKNVD
jgi:hypothetical protein